MRRRHLTRPLSALLCSFSLMVIAFGAASFCDLVSPTTAMAQPPAADAGDTTDDTTDAADTLPAKKQNVLAWTWKALGPIYTAIFLLLASVVALFTAISIKRRRGYFHWFFVTVGALFLLGFLEEINYGQRILNFNIPDFFLKNSEHPNLNLHNLFRSFANKNFDKFRIHYFKTRTIVQLAAIVYGVYLPILAFTGIGRRFFNKTKLVVPPLELLPGFVLAAVLLSDVPTGREEEYGELLLSLCFLLQMWLEKLTHTENPYLPEIYPDRALPLEEEPQP